MTSTPPTPSAALERAITYIDEHESSFREQLLDFLRIPSVSSDSARLAAMREAADWTRAWLDEAGLQTEILPTDGHPVVYAERTGHPGGKTVLIYGHYDVQPAVMADGWYQQPFEPTIQGDVVVARGATDDKGQALALLAGLKAAIHGGVGESVHVKVIIEGEEEIGSPSLVPFIREHRERLQADVVVISDSSQLGPDQPAITYGLRGLQCLEAVFRGPAHDLHSGSYGGAVVNPANVLARVISACQDPFGRIAIPGFYDRVRDLPESERQAFAALPFDEDAFRAEVGAPALGGEEGFTTLERKWARPTLDVNGLVSGHTGEGFKTVLPAEARAKFSMRLVPDQDPEEIRALTEEYIRSLLPEGVTVEFLPEHGARPVVTSIDSPEFAAATRAIELAFGKRPCLIREGGSIPVVNTFKEELGIDSLLIGLGLPDDGAHGPNEKFSLRDFRRGMITLAALLEELG